MCYRFFLWLRVNITFSSHNVVPPDNVRYMSMHEKKPAEAETRSAALEFQASYRNTKFITVFTRSSHWPMTWASWAQSIHSLSIALRPTSILFCNLWCNPISTDNSITKVQNLWMIHLFWIRTCFGITGHPQGNQFRYCWKSRLHIPLR